MSLKVPSELLGACCFVACFFSLLIRMPNGLLVSPADLQICYDSFNQLTVDKHLGVFQLVAVLGGAVVSFVCLS